MSENFEALVPKLGVITEIRVETADIKTFRVVTPDGEKPFNHMPGQCAMLSIPGVGEAMFSITSSPTVKEYMEFSIKKCGCVTEWLHQAEPGQMVTIRGPYGKPFPVDTEFVGKNLLFIAGGVGLAPLHSVINYCRANREKYGRIDVVVGSRTKADTLDYDEMVNEWSKEENFGLHLTTDRATPDWDGHVGFLPAFLTEIGFDTDRIAVLCGPPIAIKLSLAALYDLGFDKTQVYTTLELRMKCGIGKCGRCNVGTKYVCKDGPVFRFDELAELPDEY